MYEFMSGVETHVTDELTGTAPLVAPPAQLRDRLSPPPPSQVAQTDQERWQESARKANELRRQLGPIGAPVWGTYGFYSGVINRTPSVVPSAFFLVPAVGAPLAGALIARRWRDDAVGMGAGAVAGGVALGTMYALLASILFGGQF